MVDRRDIDAGLPGDFINTAEPWARAVAVEDKRIVYVGDEKGVGNFIDQGTKVINLKGRLLLPGFIDTHAHPVLAAGNSEAVALDLEGSIEDWLAAVKTYAEANPDRPGILGFGFLAATFGPNGPSKALLDKVVPDRPVVLIDEGGHSAWVNSRALEQAGIDRDTPDPIPGVHFYQRDAQGNLTGWCLEAMTFYPMVAKLGLVSEDTILAGADQTFGMFSVYGVTTIYDAGFTQFEDFAYPALHKLNKQGRLPFRVVSSHMIQSPAHLAGAIDKLRSYRKKYTSELVQPRVMKIHNDGTKEAFTAALFEPYRGQPDNRGSVLLAGKTLQNFVVATDRAGFDIHIHAIGDRAVDEALDAFEVARKVNPGSRNRYSIGHTELVRDRDLHRFAELGVVAQTTPYWFANDGKTEVAALGRARAEKLYRFRKNLDAGARVTFGSDFPATGELFGVSPIVNIEMGMTRKFYGEKPMPVTPPEGAQLTLEEMIRAIPWTPPTS